jgi:ribokinase
MDCNKIKKLTVIGSANYDTFIEVERVPEIGETISGKSLKNACGGKGANQAAAIGKLGYRVCFVAQVGKDSSGATILNELKKNNVNVKSVKELDDMPTGQAFILTYPNKDNSIVIVGGANMDWKQNDLDDMKKSIYMCKDIYLFS